MCEIRKKIQRNSRKKLSVSHGLYQLYEKHTLNLILGKYTIVHMLLVEKH